MMHSCEYCRDGYRHFLEIDHGGMDSYATRDCEEFKRPCANHACYHGPGGPEPDPTAGPFTVPDAAATAVILGLATRGAKLARLVTADSDPVYGTARSLGHRDSTFWQSGDDVRSLYLRVTTVQGFDVYWAVPELIESYCAGLLFPDVSER